MSQENLVDETGRRIDAGWQKSVFGVVTSPDEQYLAISYTDVPPGAKGEPRLGLWDRATGQYPFDLAPRWQNAKGKVDPKTVFDFVSDNDIIGGNSGSPAINAKGEVVGAIFDGNIESLGGNFGFDDRVNRAVAVSTAAITEALRNIYHADNLVGELTK